MHSSSRVDTRWCATRAVFCEQCRGPLWAGVKTALPKLAWPCPPSRPNPQKDQDTQIKVPDPTRRAQKGPQPEVVIWGREGCSHCASCKTLLIEKRIPFNLMWVKVDFTVAEFKAKFPTASEPQHDAS